VSQRRPLPQNFAGQALRGFVYPFEALQFMRQNDLWGLAVVAILINVVLLVAAASVFFFWVLPFLQSFDQALAEVAQRSGWLASVVSFAGALARVLLVVLAVGIGGLVVVLLVSCSQVRFWTRSRSASKSACSGRRRSVSACVVWCKVSRWRCAI
jgi:hypothetical protein